MLSTLRQDVTYALRSFSHSPGLAAAIIISIGLGIGANTTVFSVINELLIKDVPVRDPHALFTLAQDKSTTHSYPDFVDYRAVPDIAEGVAAHCPIVPANLNTGGVPQRIWGEMVSGNYFQLLGVPLAMGRGIGPSEDEVQLRNPVVVLGHGLWQRLGADPAMVGKTVRLSGTQYTVVGVTAPGFLGTDRGLAPEFWAPLAMRKQLWPDLGDKVETSRNNHWIEITLRLKPGVTRDKATAALNVIAARINAEVDKNRHPSPVRLAPAGHFPDIGPLVSILMTALSVVVGLVLLIACANVANLLLARAATRQREIGVRLSMGASRLRLVRQLLTESLLLSAAGAIFGFLIAVPGTAALAKFQPPIPIPIRFDFAPDFRVLGYTSALAVLTGVIFGLAPALAGTRMSLASITRATALGAGGGSNRGRMGALLVGVQVALSLVLLIASGLFLRSLQNASSIDLGMRPEGVLIMSMDTKALGYSSEKAGRFFRDLDRRLSALPGVQSVSYTNIMPLSLASSSHGYRDPAKLSSKPVEANNFDVGPRYFETMGIPLIQGRDFTDRDLKTPVVLINKTLASRMFGNENPVGRQIRQDDDKTAKVFDIIGVVGDSKAETLGEQQAACLFRYLPSDFSEAFSLLGTTVVLRSSGDPAKLKRSVLEEIQLLDRDMAVFGLDTMTNHVGRALMLPRICAALFGLFGSIGLVLATVGLYGVVNYSVRTRTREIGIRMALGARPGRVAATMARQALIVVCAAVAAGMGVALALSRFTASLLYGITPTDAVTFIAVPAILVGVSLAAVLFPALRAARLEPMIALRYE